MGALRVMSYTFDILRAGKQNCALAEIFPLRTPPRWWEFLAHRTNLLSGRVVWRKLRHSTFFFFIGGGGRNHSKQEMRRAVAKVELICPTCGCPVVKFKESYTSRLSIHREYRNCNQSPPPGPGGWASSLHTTALEFQLKLDAVAQQLPLHTPRTLSNAFNNKKSRPC